MVDAFLKRARAQLEQRERERERDTLGSTGRERERDTGEYRPALLTNMSDVMGY